MAYGHTIPITLDKFLNQIPYPIEVPEYAMRKHKAFESGELLPFYIPDKNALVLTRATIAMMIDFTSRTIPFKILQGDDIIEIYRYLGEYIIQLREYSEIEEAASYITKATHFRDKLTRSIQILAHTNPKAKVLVEGNTLTELFDNPMPGKTL